MDRAAPGIGISVLYQSRCLELSPRFGKIEMADSK